jgi:hypothetical protein
MMEQSWVGCHMQVVDNSEFVQTYMDCDQRIVFDYIDLRERHMSNVMGMKIWEIDCY